MTETIKLCGSSVPERHDQLWTAMLARCRAGGIPDTTMANWLERGRPLRIDDGRLVVEVPTNIYRWTVRRYSKLLGEAARAEGLKGVRLVSGVVSGDGRIA